MRIVLVLIAFSVFINERRVSNAADDLMELLPTSEIEGLGDVWTQFDGLSRRGYFRASTADLQRALIERTMTLSDRVIANYRTASPTVREAQWRTAREVLARAVGVTPGNRQLRAALRYCEGHLHRINGEAQKTRQDGDGGQRELTEAVAAFREAAQLRPGWPDPFLGLVRTFAYGLEDVDRGADALRQAQRNGYTADERETAQIADGYRARGNALVRSARQATGTPQEREYLTRAGEAYRQSLDLYGKATGFANVAFNVRLSQRALSQVEQRLEEIEELAKEPPQEAIPWV